jgi:hypothetical protein
LLEQAHHDFGVDQILGAAEGDEADGRARSGKSLSGFGAFGAVTGWGWGGEVDYEGRHTSILREIREIRRALRAGG